MPRTRSAKANNAFKRWLIRNCLSGLVVVILVTLGLVGIWYGSRVDSLTVSKVEVAGNETVSVEVIEETTSDLLDGSYLGLVPYRFAPMVPLDKIETVLKKELPRIQSIAFEKAVPTLHLTIEEYSPFALWCLEDERNNCLYIADTGYAFAKAPELYGGTFYRFITLDNKPEIGQYATDHRQMVDAVWFADHLEKILNFSVFTIEINQFGEMFFIRHDNSTIKIIKEYPVVESFRYLETLQASGEFSDIFLEEFDYLDARFGNKLFFKQETATSSTSTTTTEEATATSSESVSEETATSSTEETF